MSAPQPMEPATTIAPWHAAYPAPRNTELLSVTREEVLAMLEAQREGQGSCKKRDFLLVDLRRVDHEVRHISPFLNLSTPFGPGNIDTHPQGGTIRGSINLPAQSLYPAITTLYSVLKAAGVRKVIWYCSSSRGRGPRAAGWFSDYLSDQSDGDMQSLVLVNGIKGWATAGPAYSEWMDEYDEAVWAKK
ncbi:hypothetical protein MAPG_10203 [Magnaporthiopsis poae ATCC 64411]|uniref:Rhodanese domain-containing protein n=1 Tax=Magnaporthiopsis poae (strain ATCC 64411 / 73-15) TaxID=644358 RepID=A0A0C4EBZ1_MAGP6|nr:hypothetical protein MAPG_10203 [Magnaporthiopsis poae ATCC 64411]